MVLVVCMAAGVAQAQDMSQFSSELVQYCEKRSLTIDQCRSIWVHEQLKLEQARVAELEQQLAQVPEIVEPAPVQTPAPQEQTIRVVVEDSRSNRSRGMGQEAYYARDEPVSTASGRRAVVYEQPQAVWVTRSQPIGTNSDRCVKLANRFENYVIRVYGVDIPPKSTFYLNFSTLQKGEVDFWVERGEIDPYTRMYVPIDSIQTSVVMPRRLDGSASPISEYDFR
jgi:hypothetical protein